MQHACDIRLFDTYVDFNWSNKQSVYYTQYLSN